MAICPVCNETASESSINVHLDKGCPKFKAKKQWTFVSPDPKKTEPAERKPERGSPSKELTPGEHGSKLEAGTKPNSGSVAGKLEPKPEPKAEPKAQSQPEPEPKAKRLKLAPLAEQMRPQSPDEYIGQAHLMGPHGIFTEILRMPDAVLPSMVLWGPSGVGKTSLARVLAKKTQAKFIELSAPSAGSQDVKRIMGEARKDWQLLKRRTILFLDEIHRFNRSQQDSLLSGVERGDVTLVGATTENPSFKLSGALLSRMRVFVLQPLTKPELREIVERAADGIDPKIVDLVVDAASATGDARQALNMLETVRHLPAGADPALVLRHSLVYDQRGEFHYDLISALHKSVRGGDADAGLYYLGRMLEGGEDPLYVSRRLMRMASEDIGLADDSCLPFAVAVHTTVQQIGMPECDVMLAHAVVKFARAPKSVDVYKALGAVRQQIRHDPQTSGAPVPMHLRNAPTKLMDEQGYGHNYKYNPNYRGPVYQEYLPRGIDGKWLGSFQPHLDDHP